MRGTTRRGTEKFATKIAGIWRAKCQSVDCQFPFTKGSFLSAYYDAAEHAKHGHTTDICKEEKTVFTKGR